MPERTFLKSAFFVHMLQDFYNKASTLKTLLMKGVVLYGVILTALYLIFRAYYINFNPALLIFSVLLFIAELHTILLMFAMFYSLWPRKYKTYEKPNVDKNLQVNMFITTAGEPFDIVMETIDHAKKAADHYWQSVEPFKKPRVIVLNDGKARIKEGWEKIASYCLDKGVYHIARETNEGFKAGNINNGLKNFPATDPRNTIDCFLDADFSAKKDFILEIIKPLADSSVDFVQSPQRYKNLNTWVAKAAGAHQIFFFDYICPAKAKDNALFLCGTNYAIRREALLAAGGVDSRFVTEDYATSIKLHLLGKKGVFISKVLALGMAPMNLKEYFNQQARWCKGCLDANGKYFKELFFGSSSLRQKFHYFFSTAYYFIGVRDLILVLAPLPYLFFGTSLIRTNASFYLVLVYLPLMLFNFLMFFLTFKHPLKSLVLDIISFPVFAVAFLSSIFKRNLPFTVTIKKYEKENPFKIYKIQLAVSAILIAGICYSVLTSTTHNAYGRFINYFWASYDAIFLMIGFWFILKENISLGISVDSRLPRFLSAGTRYVYSLAKLTAVVVIAIIVGLGAPIVYDIAAKDPERLVDKARVKTSLAFVNFNKKPELLVPSNGAYYGYYASDLNLHPYEVATGLLPEETPTLAMFYQDWNKDSGFDGEFLKRIADKGAIPVVTWEPFDSQNKESELNKDGSPEKLILEGVYDDYIRLWAMGAKSYKKPFFLRFAHEMNGNWYAWGDVEEGSSEKYKKMWIHIHRIFDEIGADNVLWVWSPNNTNHLGEVGTITDFYPGSEFVDWVGFSSFNWGSANPWNKWMDFKTASWRVYTTLSELDKPIMVAETSSVSAGGEKSEWFWQTFIKDIPSMPLIKAVILFNQDADGADFSLESGMDEVTMVKMNLVDNGYYLKDLVVIYR